MADHCSKMAATYWVYRKSPKFSDTKNFCCKQPKIQTKRPNLRLFCQNGAKGIANIEDPDLIWVCTVCPDLSVQKLRVITVHVYCTNNFALLYMSKTGRQVYNIEMYDN